MPGRRSFHVLIVHPGSIHVFEHAPECFWVGRVMEARNIIDLSAAQTPV